MTSLTTLPKGAAKLDSVHYFGHSNGNEIFLEYSSNGLGKGAVTRGVLQAGSIPKTLFVADSVFVSHGCNQADPVTSARCSDAPTLRAVMQIGTPSQRQRRQPLGQKNRQGGQTLLRRV